MRILDVSMNLQRLRTHFGLDREETEEDYISNTKLFVLPRPF